MHIQYDNVDGDGARDVFFFLAGANPLYYYYILTTVLHTHIYQRWSRQGSECTGQPLYYSTTTIYSLPYRLLHMFTHICTTHIQIHTCICTTPILLYHHCILTTVPFTTHVYTYVYTYRYTHTYLQPLYYSATTVYSPHHPVMCVYTYVYAHTLHTYICTHINTHTIHTYICIHTHHRWTRQGSECTTPKPSDSTTLE